MTELQLLGLRLLAYGLIAVGLFGYGFVKGLHQGEADKEVFIAKQQELGVKQEASNAKLLVKQKEINQNEKNDSAKRLDGLRAFYAVKLRNTSTNGSKMPITTNSTKESNGATPEPTTCPSTTSSAEDALRVLEWQSWAIKQGFVVE